MLWNGCLHLGTSLEVYDENSILEIMHSRHLNNKKLFIHKIYQLFLIFESLTSVFKIVSITLKTKIWVKKTFCLIINYYSISCDIHSLSRMNKNIC